MSLEDQIRKIIAVAVIAASALMLTSCGKEVDKKAVNAQLVHGTNNLYWFCDANGTLIYFEDITGSDDEYEAMWYGVCVDSKPQKIPNDVNGNNGGANG